MDAEMIALEAIVNYADTQNKERGIKCINGWFSLNPEDDHRDFVGYDNETGVISGPLIKKGTAYKICYSNPLVLPFQMIEQGKAEKVFFHVSEIQGTLDTDSKIGFILKDAKLTICAPDDYSKKTTTQFTKSLFRLCHDDEIRELVEGNQIEELNTIIPPPNTKEFPLFISTCNEELMKWISHHPEDLKKVDHRTFEKIVVEILSSFNFEVELTQTTRDGGYDIFAIKKDLLGITTRYIIECKHPLKNKVSVQPVRQLYAVKEQNKVEHAMLITDYYFTRDAWQFAQSPHIWNLHLRDKNGFLEWLESYKKIK